MGALNFEIAENKIDLYVVRPTGEKTLFAGLVHDSREWTAATIDLVNASLNWADVRSREVEAEMEKGSVDLRPM